MSYQDQNLLRRIHDYQRISGILWIVWGIMQVMSICVFFIFGIPVALVGIWNIYAGITSLKIAPEILAGHSSIPSRFESLTGLIVIAIINLFFGAMIGVIFCLIDFYVRDQILSNRHLFVNSAPQAVRPPTYP